MSNVGVNVARGHDLTGRKVPSLTLRFTIFGSGITIGPALTWAALHPLGRLHTSQRR